MREITKVITESTCILHVRYVADLFATLKLDAFRLITPHNGKTEPPAAGMSMRRTCNSHVFSRSLTAGLMVLAAWVVFMLPSKAQNSQAGSALQFSASVEGSKIPDDIRAKLEDSVELERKDTIRPVAYAQLRRRANEDAVRLNKVLRSEAYYNGEVSVSIRQTDAGRLRVVYTVSMGPRTFIRSFRILYTDSPPDEALLPADGAALGLLPGKSVRAQRVIDLTADALTYLANHGYPDAVLADREVIVDLAAQLADVTLKIAAGGARRFGPVMVRNTGSHVRNDYVRSFVTFDRGATYDRRQVSETLDKLRKTGLFESVALTSSKPDENGEVAQIIALSERPVRSIGMGASWATDEGPGVRSFWEHRSIFGRGEKLRLALEVAQLEQNATAELRKPRFLREDQVLSIGFEVAHENKDAYDENRVKTVISLSRTLNERWEASVGVSAEVENTQDIFGNHAYQLLGLPLAARYDGTDDLFDPKQGSRLNLSLVPYGGRSNSDLTSITRIEATGSSYVSFGEKKNLTLAGRVRLGTLIAQDTTDVPGSIRFYAGGGGSIRGYGYQLAGPLDINGDPAGGRSVLEVSGEIRGRVSRDIGLVAFVDGGNSYSTSVLKFSQPLLWGAGVGMRYYTPIGPVRVDIAFPLNKRGGVDDSFQIYFSLGQAF